MSSAKEDDTKTAEQQLSEMNMRKNSYVSTGSADTYNDDIDNHPFWYNNNDFVRVVTSKECSVCQKKQNNIQNYTYIYI